jgi:sec-independent protein translocase protein TatA
MGFRGLFEGWHIVILVLVIVVVFGWKRLPDASRSLGRSMRIFKSEITEMKTDGKTTGAGSSTASPASAETVRGDVVPPVHETPAETAGGSTTTAAPTPPFADSPLRETTPAPAPQDHQHSA